MIPRTLRIAGLTLVATLLTLLASPALAEGTLIGPPPPPVEPATEPAAAPTPPAEPGGLAGLSLRPSQPLELESSSSGPSIGGGLLLLALVAGGALLAHRARKAKTARLAPYTLRVLSRTPIGIRSELAVIEVDDQVILLGVTPSSIQRIAELSPDAALARASEPVAPAAARVDRIESADAAFDALLQAADKRSRRAAADEPRASSAPASRARPRPTDLGDMSDRSVVEEQIRGLLGGRAA
jgi:flagellar biogenesis protein FliO